jgi:L-fuculose-phosphate aldolase
MVNEWEIRKQIIEIGRRIWVRGFVASNDGNISVRLNDDEILTTPHGVSKGFMTTDMIIKCDRSAKVLSGNKEYHPSSELKMHLDVYKERPDIRSVVHAHPQYATSFAVAGIPLNKCVLPEAIIVIGAVPIAPYGLPSTMEIPDRARPFIRTSDAILLENHGALTLGTSLLDAYHKMETLEHTASIVWKAIEKFNLPGRVTACDATPMPSSTSVASGSGELPAGIDEATIRSIAEQVIGRLGAR